MAETITIPGAAAATPIQIVGSFTQAATDQFVSALTGSPTDDVVYFSNLSNSGATTVPAGSTKLLFVSGTPATTTIIPNSTGAAATVGGSVSVSSALSSQINLLNTYDAAGGSSSTGSGTFAISPGASPTAPAVIFGTTVNDIAVNTGGDETIKAGAGEDVIFSAAAASVGGSTYYIATTAASSTLLIGGATADTVVAGPGQAVIIGGTGSDLIYGGAGKLVFVGGASSATVIAGTGSDTLLGEAGSNISLIGDTNKNYLVAGAGNETLNAANAEGANQFFGGSGNTLFEANALGKETFSFTAGLGGGSDTITGYGSRDLLNLYGSNNTTITVTPAGTQILLSDGTKVLLAGYTGPTNIHNA